MTPTELKAFILALPNDHPARVAFLAADDVACAAALNALVPAGYIARRDLVVALANYGAVDGLMRWVLTFGTMPAALGGGAASFPLFCLCQQISRLAASDTNVLLTTAKLTAAIPGVQPLIDAGAIPQAFFDDLFEREAQAPLMSVSVTQVGEARNNG